jgi:hypothetical protein
VNRKEAKRRLSRPDSTIPGNRLRDLRELRLTVQRHEEEIVRLRATIHRLRKSQAVPQRATR